jgi:enamine deaminase RidA (YjgF/YER057c/UK114 family)
MPWPRGWGWSINLRSDAGKNSFAASWSGLSWLFTPLLCVIEFHRTNEATTMSAEARLKQLGITLPEVPAPVANYLPYRIAGNLLFLAGQGPRGADGKMLTGKVGAEVSVEEGYQRARIIGLQLLSATRIALGSLDRVDSVLKMLCMVNAVPEFKDHPKVANGMSDLFVEVLGDAGKHARSAVGMGSLPNQISVEIEGILSIKS